MPEESRPAGLGDLIWQGIVRIFGRRWGLAIFIVLSTCISIYLGWDSVSKLPGIAQVADRVSRRPIPKADPNRFSVMVAYLEDDVNREQERLIIEALKEFQGIQVLSLDRTIPLEGSVPEEQEKRGHESARNYLKQSGASVLIWGMVLSSGGKVLPKLYWTVSEGPARKPGRYDSPRAEMQFRLPELFWSDLAAILRLLVASRNAEFKAKEGHYVADRLPSFISQVGRLLEASEGKPGWDSNTKEATRVILADALAVLGEQSGKTDYLEQAVAAYQEALKELTRDRVPLQWATIQNNLGNALFRIGELDSGTVRLKEAVIAYREALKESTRNREPLEWAMTQNNLGAALMALGERESGTDRLKEAVTVFREALNEQARDRVPLQWAATQVNLGNALFRIGERESGTGRLKEAVTVFYAALKEFTRDRVPLQWAATQVNLGNALFRIGEREGHAIRLNEAVAAYREALKEFIRDRVPLDWAGTQRDLGNALFRLGQRESDTVRLNEAVAAYREALKELTRDRVPLDWAGTQHGLGNALFWLGNWESDTGHLKESVAAYRAALGVLKISYDRSLAKKTEDALRRSEALLAQRRH